MKTKTERGFSIFGQLEDSRGCKIRVQESSAAGAPHIYVFCQNSSRAYHTQPPEADVPMHLNAEQAQKLRDALDLFVQDAADPKNWRNDPEYVATWRRSDG